jgi:hypothetical protein
MPQEDYFKKEIDKLGKVLAKAVADLLSLKSKGQLMDGIDAASHVLKTELDTDLETLASLPVNALLPFLVSEKKLNNVQLELIGDLLFESAGNDPAAAAKYDSALAIYKAVTDNEPDYSVNRHYKIELIRQLSGNA